MRLLKYIKKIIRKILMLIMYFHKDKPINSYNNSLKYLNNIYPIKRIDFDCCKLNIESYECDLSLIVPVFNASNYINKCIDSLLNQNTLYKYEIICIDDGSTDNSYMLLSDYDDAKLKLIHQENKGISAARNVGLDIAKGKYIGFIDDDDYVSSDYVDKLLKKAFEENADYVRCSYCVFSNQNNRIKEIKKYGNEIFILSEQLDKDFIITEVLTGFIWGGIYKREIWKNVCFPSNYWFEDIIKSQYLYNLINILANVNDILYFKRKHKKNASKNLWKKRDLKSLDHLYLILLFNNVKRQKSINNKLISICSNLMELGGPLYRRTFCLPSSIKKHVFYVGSDIIKENDYSDIRFKNNEYNILLKSFLSKDYRLWNLINIYMIFNDNNNIKSK